MVVSSSSTLHSPFALWNEARLVVKLQLLSPEQGKETIYLPYTKKQWTSVKADPAARAAQHHNKAK